MTPDTGRALHGIRVLDLSRVLAGPWATQMLADYGADVVKVERPLGGDETRTWGPPFLAGPMGTGNLFSAYFLAANRGKRSIALDLNNPVDQRVIRDLACHADVLIENFRPGTLDRFDLGYETLRHTNPQLVYCSITGFGLEGPYSQRPGYDAMIQAAGGLMSITGHIEEEGNDEPVKVGVAVADLFTGLYAVTGILAALQSRARSGTGQHVSVSLFDSQVSMLANQALNYLVSGKTPEKRGTGHPNIVPYQAFRATDGYFLLAVGNDSQFSRLADLVGHPAWKHDGRFSSNASRVLNRKDLVDMLSTVFLKQSREYWLGKLEENLIPASPIQSLDQLAADPHVLDRQLFFSMPHSSGVELPQLANPVQFSDTPVVYEKPPPELGVHGSEVLADWLEWTVEQIDEWQRESIQFSQKDSFR